MRRQEYGRIRRRHQQLFKTLMVGMAQIVYEDIHRLDAKIDSLVRLELCWLMKPLPGFVDGPPVNRVAIAVWLFRVRFANQDCRLRLAAVSKAFQPAKPLAERIEAGTLCDQCFKAEVGANFKTLGRDSDDGLHRSIGRTR